MKEVILKKPELLAPAGDLEKLFVAVTYGADAVYIGGQQLGLRAKAKNFDQKQMEEGVRFAHEHQAKVYVTANIFAHNADFFGMENYFLELRRMRVDGLIVSDPGVFALARQTVPDMPIHISTQANNTNYHSALFWQKLGAKRVVAARELSIEEIADTRRHLTDDFELEAFVHGAMCVSISGRCLLSNYLTNRDANRGACSHPCRWKYRLDEEQRPNEYMPVYEDERGAYIFNSKDLCLIEHIPQLVEAGIQSFKIEGRMKSPYYVATVVAAYRQAIDDFFSDPVHYESKKSDYLTELKKSSHRNFTTGFYFSEPGSPEAKKPDMQIYDTSAYIRSYSFVGLVLDYNTETKIATIQQRNKFTTGESVEILRSCQSYLNYTIENMTDESGAPIFEAPHAQQIVKMRIDQPIKKYDMLRKIEQP